MENENVYQEAEETQNQPKMENQYQNPPFQDSNYNQPMTPPANNMVLAIVATVVSVLLCCCSYGVTSIGLVLGIIAIVLSSQVESKFAAGDYSGAEQSAKTSKLLSYISLGIIALGFILSIVLIFTGVLAGIFESMQHSM